MTEHDLEPRLRVLLARVIEDELTITRDDNLFQLGILDSVLLIRLIAELEQAFGISVADREMIPDYFLSLHRLSVYVQRKLERAAEQATAVLPAQGS